MYTISSLCSLQLLMILLVFSKRDLYSLPEIKLLLNNYISSHNLVNARDQAYINLDSLLLSCVSAKSKGKSKKDDEAEVPILEFMKRDELAKKVAGQMQSWHEIKIEGKDPMSKFVQSIRSTLPESYR